LTLQLLSDGKWHQIKEVEEKLKLSTFEVQKIMIFLDKYGFAVFDSANLKMKVNPDFKRLLIQSVN
jgi:hypothetical protein